MLNLCGMVVAILKMATGRNFSMSGINSGHHNLPTYEMSLKSDNVEFVRYWRPFWKWRPVEIFRCRESIRDNIIYPHMKWRWNRTMLNLCGIVVAILKMATGRNFSMLGINSDMIIYPHIKFWWYRAILNFYRPFFYTVFRQPFWKWQTTPKFWKRIIAPLMVTYHYVKLYVSISIHLEVININVRNFNFPIGFYSNPHPIWTPQNMTLTPFTTKMKMLWPTRNIYLKLH
jgi:hypothetical protein